MRFTWHMTLCSNYEGSFEVRAVINAVFVDLL